MDPTYFSTATENHGDYTAVTQAQPYVLANGINLPVSEEHDQITTSPLTIPQAYSVFQEASTLGLDPWMLKFQKAMPDAPLDVFSNARPLEAVTTHLKWNVEKVDFEKKEISATAIYSFTNKTNTDVLMLDVGDLEIEKITVNDLQTKYTIEKSTVENKPNALCIPIPSDKAGGKVEIQYHTTSSSGSVYWIDKEYTEGKKFPMVYTLFEPNDGAHAIPGQHSPQIRMNYEVNVKTNDPNLIALSSVPNNPKVRNETGEYSGLRTDRAFPLYLLSLHVGNFSFSGYENESNVTLGVYSEDAMLAEVSESFKNLPEIMKSAEKICGPYNWKTYTPIILPYAFPYGAMEHPCISTCGRTAMERKSIVPHELGHSWSGNDITNANWQQLCWNEGLVTVLQYFIAAEVFGEAFADMEYIALMDEVKAIMEAKKEKTPDALRLCQQTHMIGISLVPYGKGALFFFMLREVMGNDIFFTFLKDYMKVFYQNSMSDNRLLEFLKLWLANKAGINDFDAFKEKHHIDDWLYGLDIPQNAPKFHSIYVDEFKTEYEKFSTDLPLDTKKIGQWDLMIQVLFLKGIVPLAKSENLEKIKNLDKQLNLTSHEKMTIREEWAVICAKAGLFTEDTEKMLINYIIERNSIFRTDKISLILRDTEQGRNILGAILNQENGRLFHNVREKIKENLKAANVT